MDLRFTPEQEAFRREVRAFIDARLPASLRESMRAGHRPTKSDIVSWQRTLHERGWAAPHWPKAYGGAELSQAERLILTEEMSRAPTPKPLSFNVTMLGPVLLRFGTQSQREFWLPQLANLDIWFAQGFSEPGSGSDLASLRTSARREGERYVVNGQKTWTSLAQHADMVFCLVRTGGGNRKQDDIAFLLVDLKSPGVTVRPIDTIDGEASLNEVFFDDVSVPAENLVGREGQGWEITRFLLANERTGIADVATCRERLDFASGLARRVTQSGSPMIDDPQIGSELAWLDAEVRMLEITNWRLLLSREAQSRNAAFASVLKLKGTDLQQQIAALTLRIIGPQALERPSPAPGERPTWSSAPATRYLFSRAASIYGGTNEVQKDLLSRAVLG